MANYPSLYYSPWNSVSLCEEEFETFCGLCSAPIHNPYSDKPEYDPSVDENGDPVDYPPRDIEEEDRRAAAEELRTGQRRLVKPEADVC